MSETPAILYGELLRVKQEAETALKVAKENLVQAEREMLSWFEETGASSVTVGNQTLFLARQLWARKKADVPDSDAAELLESHDLGWLAPHRINVQKLSAYVRELVAKDETLPDDLAEIVTIDEAFKVGHRTRQQ